MTSVSRMAWREWMYFSKLRAAGLLLRVPERSGREVTQMVQNNRKYKVVRTLPRAGELYAVTLRSGITEIRKANRDFRRDKRRIFIPDEAA